MNQEDIKIYQQFQKSPIYFIQEIWHLKPQPVRNEFKDLVDTLIQEGRLKEIEAKHFDNFIKGEHLTWQEWLILLAVERAIQDRGLKKISIVSGHGIGKDATLSWLIIWYLFCFKDAQIPCTAPTSDLMHDVLWKEIKVWLDKMPTELSALYEWSTGYLRIKEAPETWFARARTARKESPEALQGVHGNYVMIPVDEASGVPEEIFKAAESSLTGDNTLVILIGNGTRAEGYFYNSHHSDKHNFQTLQFSSEDSPIVDRKFVDGIIEKYGTDSDEYKIRVAGGFPRIEQMDSFGWINLIDENRIIMVSPEVEFMGRLKMGVDPSGEGDNWTKWYIRDRFVAKRVAKEQTSNSKTIASKTITLIDKFGIQDNDIVIDNFGEGANVSRDIALFKQRIYVRAINWAEEATNSEDYLNKRAECYFRAQKWLLQGGAIIDEDLKKEFSKIKFKNNINGKKQIMPKKDLIKILGQSPDDSDAFAMTFYDDSTIDYIIQPSVQSQQTHSDVHSAI